MRRGSATYPDLCVWISLYPWLSVGHLTLQEFVSVFTWLWYILDRRTIFQKTIAQIQSHRNSPTKSQGPPHYSPMGMALCYANNVIFLCKRCMTIFLYSGLETWDLLYTGKFLTILSNPRVYAHKIFSSICSVTISSMNKMQQSPTQIEYFQKVLAIWFLLYVSILNK